MSRGLSPPLTGVPDRHTSLKCLQIREVLNGLKPVPFSAIGVLQSKISRSSDAEQGFFPMSLLYGIYEAWVELWGFHKLGAKLSLMSF